MSKTIWSRDEGWKIPKLPEPENGHYVLAVSSTLSPLHAYELLERIETAGYRGELNWVSGDPGQGNSLYAYFIGQFPIEDRSAIAALTEAGIERDWILAPPIDTEEDMRSRETPDLAIEDSLVPESVIARI